MKANMKLSKTTKLNLDRIKHRRILFGFNLANDFTATTKLFLKHGIHADILVRNTGDVRNFNLVNPLWEDPAFDRNYIKIWNSPKKKINQFFHGFELRRSYFFNQLNLNYCGRLSKMYDIVITTSPGELHFYKHKNLIIYDAGGFRRLLGGKATLTKMALKSYLNTKFIIFTNPDMKCLFYEAGIKELKFMPLVADITRYTPKPKQKNSIFTILMPSRQNWKIKASHHLIHAFAYASKNNKMKLQITKWGIDLNRTKTLVKKLKIEKKVEYLPLVNKTKLIERINNADVIADQFVYGSYALTSIEAMACAKPVLAYININANKQCFGEVPPIVNCQSIQSIKEMILELYFDEKKVKAIGKKSRKWVEEKHNPQIAFEQQARIIYDTLGK